MDHRPGWDEYFLNLADLASTRSTCLRRKVGAVLVKSKHVLATGYNGSPEGLAHCRELGCLREAMKIPSGQRHEICRAIHAEQNAIIQAARHGVSIIESTLYCTNQPCAICAKMIINAGVNRLICKEAYPDEISLAFLREAEFAPVTHGAAYYIWEKQRP